MKNGSTCADLQGGGGGSRGGSVGSSELHGSHGTSRPPLTTHSHTYDRLHPDLVRNLRKTERIRPEKVSTAQGTEKRSGGACAVFRASVVTKIRWP